MSAPTIPHLLAAPTATRARRSALWGLVGTVLVAVAALRVTYASAGLLPTFATSAVLDGAALAALALAYRLVVAARGGAPASTPLRALGLATGALFVLAGVTALAESVLGVARLSPGGRPADSATALAGAAVGLAEGLTAVGVAASLRSLMLVARRRAVVVAWRVGLAAGVGSALLVAGRPPVEPPPEASLALLVLAVLAGTGLALRQSAPATLTGRDRWRGAGLAAGLLAAVAAVYVVRGFGPGGPGVPPLGMLVGRSPDTALTVASSVAAVYGVAALLALLIGLPGTAATERRDGERRALRALAGLSGQVLDRDALAAAVARGPVDAGLADAAWLVLADPTSGTLTPHVAAAEGLEVSEAEAVADHDALLKAAGGRALVLGRAAADYRVRARPGRGLGTLAVVPFTAGERTGAIVAARALPEAFESDDVSALETFAGQAGLALSHASLFAEALEREYLARELALARDVQRRLFPATLPAVDGLDLAAAEQPAREVGGDYYDAVRLGPACVGLLVADVSGKGAAAAFYMAELKGIVQAASRLTRAPGDLLAQANDSMGASLARGAFVSAAYAVVDADAGTLTLGRAGHCPPILARDPARADGGVWLLRPAGLAVGLDRQGAAFRRVLGEHTVTLAPGDVLVLYTDGLIEVRNPDGEEYGYERLAAAVAAQRDRSADDIRDALLDAHRTWSAGADASDDLSLLVMRWAGRAGVAVPPPADVLPPVTLRPAFP